MSISIKANQQSFLGLILVLFSVFSAGTIFADEPYQWPLSEPTRVTSTLGEYRGDHLHNGIDFSTLKMPDRKVYAIDTGTIHRVMFDPEKYGKTVIVEHDDGRRSWYSHLDTLEPWLERALDKSLEKGTEINPSGTISVSRGQVLGRAGSTGSGGLHLHIALESSDGTFLNPIGRFKPDLPFNARPTIQSVRLMPLKSSGWIDGQPGDQLYREIPRRPIDVWGHIGLNVTLWNRHPGTANRSLPETVILKHNDRTVFRREFDALTEADQQNGLPALFDLNYSDLSPTSFTLNLTPRGSGGAWEGLSFYEEGRSGELKIIVQSRNGERAVRLLSYQAVPPPATFQWFSGQTNGDEGDVLGYDQLTEIQPASSRFLVASLTGRQTALEQYSPPQYKSVGPPPRLSMNHEWAFNQLRFSVEIDGRWKGWPKLTVSRDSFVETPSLIQVEPGRFVTWWKPDFNRDGWHDVVVSVNGNKGGDTVTKRVYLQSLRRREEGAIVSLDGRYSLFSSGEGVAFSSFVSFRERPEFRSSRDELQVVGAPFEITPDYFQSVEPMVLSADLPDTISDPGSIGLYRWNPIHKRWNVLSYEEGFSHWSREASIYQGGVMGLFRDVGDPAVQSIRRVDDKTVRVKYREEGAGVDHEGISITIDDHPVNYRWLESEGWIELAIPRDTSLSSRTLKVEIKDRAGRRTVVRKRIKNL